MIWQVGNFLAACCSRQKDRQRGGQTDRGKPVGKSSVESGCPNTQPNRTVAGANPPDKATLCCGSRFARFCGYFEKSMEFIFLNSFFLFDKKES